MSEPIQPNTVSPPSPQGGASLLPPSLDAGGRGWSDNLDLLKALFFGMVLTAVFYEIFPIPFLDQGRLLALFENDNWVSPVIMGMTFWSLFILLFKFFRFRFQSKVWQWFRRPPIETLLNRKIYARDVDRVVAELRGAFRDLRVKRFESATIYRRVLRLLYFIRGAAKKEGLDNLLDFQGQIDVKKLETSYTVLQVFIWAIPILGFIGTVLGIGFSVNEFAQFIQSAEMGGQFNAQMRAALGGVTGGLAIAFNTTFLALVLVVPVMLLTSFLQKSEEEFLLEIEEYCMEDLLPRLYVNPGEEVLSEGYEDHLHKIMRLSETWLNQFEPLVGQLSRQSEMMANQLSGIQPLVKEFTDRLMLRSPVSPPGSKSAAESTTEAATEAGAETSGGEETPPTDPQPR